jgi:hypothetical protein
MTPGSSGSAWKRIGLTFFAVGVIANFLLQCLPDYSFSDYPILYLVSMVATLSFLGGLFLFWRGRQYAAQETGEEIITSSKPHVLYLRAFRSDPSAARTIVKSLFAGNAWQIGLATEEEQLADVLRPIGDLIAIGEPGEGLPKPGAARMYASNEEWREVVKHQLQAARIVIIRVGAELGENLLWELKQAVESLDPRKGAHSSLEREGEGL